jgi:hypothetical protein
MSIGICGSSWSHQGATRESFSRMLISPATGLGATNGGLCLQSAAAEAATAGQASCACACCRPAQDYASATPPCHTLLQTTLAARQFPPTHIGVSCAVRRQPSSPNTHILSPVLCTCAPVAPVAVEERVEQARCLNYLIINTQQLTASDSPDTLSPQTAQTPA